MNRINKRLSAAFCLHPVNPVQNGFSSWLPNDCRQALRAPGSGQTEWRKPELPARNCWTSSMCPGKAVRKSLSVLSGRVPKIQMMPDLMHEDVANIEPTEPIQIRVQCTRVGMQKDTGPPV